MTRQSPVERILPVVESFIERMERLRRECLRRTFPGQEAFEKSLAELKNWVGDERLHATINGKVNVQPLMGRLNLKGSDRQWFYKSDELAGLINAQAMAQGVARNCSSPTRIRARFSAVSPVPGP